MFDLEQSITDWRRQLVAAGVQTPVPMEELECHLRDDIEARLKSGLTAQDAFADAVQQIGRPRELKKEFVKNDGIKQILKRKLVWCAVGLAVLGSWIVFGDSPVLALAYCVLLASLVIASAIDFKHFIIPDQISIGGMATGLVASCLVPALQGQTRVLPGALQSLLGIVLGAGVMYLILRAGRLVFGRKLVFGAEEVVPREVMGFGDVKLMAAIGAFLGWQAVIFSLIASSFIGSAAGVGLVAVRRREWSSRLPYGPFIALAAAIWVFFSKQILEYFQG